MAEFTDYIRKPQSNVNPVWLKATVVDNPCIIVNGQIHVNDT